MLPVESVVADIPAKIVCSLPYTPSNKKAHMLPGLIPPD